jgi:hypothetical protein
MMVGGLMKLCVALRCRLMKAVSVGDQASRLMELSRSGLLGLLYRKDLEKSCWCGGVAS